MSLALFVAGIIKKQMPAKIIVIAERLSTNPLLLDKYKDMKEMNEIINIVRKNFGKIALKTTLAFSASNFVKIMAVLITTWNVINPTIKPFASKEINSCIERFN